MHCIFFHFVEEVTRYKGISLKSIVGSLRRNNQQMRAATFTLHFNNLPSLKRLTGKEKRVGGYDLMWNDGPVYREDISLETFGGSSCTANTHLGNNTLLGMERWGSGGEEAKSSI